METSHLLDSPEPNMRHLAHSFLCQLDLMLADVDHSVCHDPSLLSEFKEAGKPSRLPLRNYAPRMGPLLLNYTTGSERVVCFV